MRILALDVGDKRIGVAVSDPTGLLARPLTIIPRKGEAADIEAIQKLAGEQGAVRVVVGLPLSLDGRIGPQAEKVQALVDKLRLSLAIPLELKDERFSTASVRERRLESGLSKKKRRAPDDADAAAIILQEYLDECR